MTTTLTRNTTDPNGLTMVEKDAKGGPRKPRVEEKGQQKPNNPVVPQKSPDRPKPPKSKGK